MTSVSGHNVHLQALKNVEAYVPPAVSFAISEKNNKDRKEKDEHDRH